MFEITVHTEIEIEAPAERVWAELADLARYPEWNPMIRRAEGELKPGARLTLTFNPPGTRPRVFRPKLLVVEPRRELRWLGHPGIPKVIESEHFFRIEPASKSKVRLVHDMVFYGLLIPVLSGFFRRATGGPFDAMNAALKKRVESRG